MDIADITKMPYNEIIDYVADCIGTDLGYTIDSYKEDGERLTDTDIIEMMNEDISDWKHKLIQKDPNIKKELLMGKLSGDGFTKDVEAKIKENFYFESDDDYWSYMWDDEDLYGHDIKE